MPLSDGDLESLAVKAAVALEMPPGSTPPDPRPRKDSLAEAHADVLRLVQEVRRHRARERGWREALRAALAENDSEALKTVAADVLDDTL